MKGQTERSLDTELDLPWRPSGRDTGAWNSNGWLESLHELWKPLYIPRHHRLFTLLSYPPVIRAA